MYIYYCMVYSILYTTYWIARKGGSSVGGGGWGGGGGRCGKWQCLNLSSYPAVLTLDSHFAKYVK